MNLLIRRIIFGFFIIAFVILAPILILYSSGFRYDAVRGQLIQTGTILVEGDTIESASIFLNDEREAPLLKKETFLDTIIPGEYTVRIEKEGYYPWERRYTVDSRRTTFIQDIVLIKDSFPAQIISDTVELISYSPDTRYAAYASASGTYLLDLTTGERSELFANDTKINSFDWAPSSKKLLVTTLPYAAHVIPVTGSPSTPQSLNALAFESLQWDEKNDSTVYGIFQNNLYQIDLVSNARTIIPRPNTENELVAFMGINKDIFSIYSGSESGQLYKYSALLNSQVPVAPVQPSDAYTFITGNDDYITLLNERLGKVTIINKNPLAQEDIFSQGILTFNAQAAQWHPNAHRILLYDGIKISYFDLSTNSEILINRYGEPVEEMLWHPSYDTLILQFSDRIELIDLDTSNGTRNTYTTVDFDSIRSLALTQDGTHILFTGSVGKQSGIYSLEIL